MNNVNKYELIYNLLNEDDNLELLVLWARCYLESLPLTEIERIYKEEIGE